ncbi:MAG: recombination protein NinB [Polaromonas sp.]|nr:recombination protein NinB [Polaromonas sp.]
MTKQLFRLVHTEARRRAAKACQDAPDGFLVTIQEPTKRRIQEEKYHAMVGDLSRQCEYAGRKWDAEDSKRILIDEFAADMRGAGTPLHNDSRIIPSQDGLRIIQLNIRSSDFYIKEAAQFIEWLYAWGADRAVVWTEPREAA